MLICRICHRAVHHIADGAQSIRQATETILEWRRNGVKPDWMRSFKHPRTARSRRLIIEEREARGRAKWQAFKERVAREKATQAIT